MKVKIIPIIFACLTVGTIIIACYSASAGNTNKKQYWIVTEGIMDIEEQTYILEESFLGNPMSTGDITCVWYTNHREILRPLSPDGRRGRKISTSLQFWGETNGDILTCNIRLYNKNNPYPETIQWKITNAGYPLKYTIYLSLYSSTGSRDGQIMIHPNEGISTIDLGAASTIIIQMSMSWG